MITPGTETLEVELDWDIYPNPSMNRLYFTLVDDLPNEVELIDSQGLILKRNILNAYIYVGDLKAGKYVIQFIHKGKKQQRDFVKR